MATQRFNPLAVPTTWILKLKTDRFQFENIDLLVRKYFSQLYDVEQDPELKTYEFSLPYTTTMANMRMHLKGLVKICEVDKVNTALSKDERKIASELEDMLDEFESIVPEPVNKKRKL